MPPGAREEAPAAIYVECPDCGEETLHTVLKGKVGKTGDYTLDAKVTCTECGRTHHVVIREAKDVELPIVVSAGNASQRHKIPLPADEEIVVGDLLIVDGRNVMITGIELAGSRRPLRAIAKQAITLWAKDYESVVVKFAINLGHKTISKAVPAKPEDLFHVGDEHTFGRLRVTVHSIKLHEKLIRRGSAEASQIARVFAKPTRPDKKPHRPQKDVRDRARELERATTGGPRARGARFGARKARETRDRSARARHVTSSDEEEEG